MGLVEKIFGKNLKKQIPLSEFRTVTAYQPVFTSWDGEMYESQLVRSCIDAIARNVAKLRVEIQGSARPKLQTKLRHGPNPWQTWSQFMYRTATILYAQNTVFIVPVFDDFGDVSGIFPLLPSRCEIREYKGTLYLRYQFTDGEMAAIEFDECALINRFQYKDDFFGEGNEALNPTLNLISMQNQGITEGIKSSATFRFMAQMTNFSDPEDLAAEQEAFRKANMSAKAGGILLFPNTWANIKQIDSKPFVIDDKQMQEIRTNCYTYFGVNDDVLMNKAFGDSWSAFYEGAIEPLAIMIAEGLTKMLFTLGERSNGAKVVIDANRMQYMSMSDKLSLVNNGADRGYLKVSEIRDILNLTELPPEIGERMPARGEYFDFSGQKTGEEPANE